MPKQPTFPAQPKQAPNYQYYNHAGRPFDGKPPLMTPDEYDTNVRTVGNSAYGLFDLRNPEDKHCGRTLKQVLDRAYLKEYQILTMEPYNNGVVDENPDQPPALFMFVMWVETFDTLSQNVKQIAQQNS